MVGLIIFDCLFYLQGTDPDDHKTAFVVLIGTTNIFCYKANPINEH